MLDQDDNLYLISLSIPIVCWIVYGYCSEKLHFNHFWKLKGQGSRMVGAWGKMGNIMGKMDGGVQY